MKTCWIEHSTPLGEMILAADENGLVGAWFPGQAHFAGVAAGWREDPSDAVLGLAAGQLDDWFAGRRRAFELPLAPRGTPFQLQVWRQIARLGFNRTASYGELAAALARPQAARAVGAATGRNPLSIIIPCHRLLARNGALTGYAGGVERKRALLDFESGRLSFAAGA